jgi:hypothetical protein
MRAVSRIGVFADFTKSDGSIACKPSGSALRWASGLAIASAMTISGCVSHGDITEAYDDLNDSLDRSLQVILKACDQLEGAAKSECKDRAINWYKDERSKTNDAYRDALDGHFEDVERQRREIEDSIRDALKDVPGKIIDKILDRSSLSDVGDGSIGVDVTGSPDGPGLPSKGPILRDRFAGPRGYTLDGIVNFGGGFGQAELVGSIAFTLGKSGEGYRGTVTRFELEIDGYSLDSTTRLTLDVNSGSNEIRLDALGRGDIGVRVFADYSNPEEGHLRSGWQYLTLPVRLEPSGSLVIDTEGEVPSYRIFPFADFPISDFDDNGSLDDSDYTSFISAMNQQNIRCDLNVDGIIDSQDLAEFDRFHMFDRNRPR